MHNPLEFHPDGLGRRNCKKGHFEKHIHEVMVECFTSNILPVSKKYQNDMMYYLKLSYFYFEMGYMSMLLLYKNPRLIENDPFRCYVRTIHHL